MMGIVPAAGCGSRIQPLGCSKELLPVGSRTATSRNAPGERPRAVSEYLIERMLLAGADRICLIISGEKTDIVRYYADSPFSRQIFFALQSQPQGLCDAVFRALPHVHAGEPVLIGLPDTIWFPEDAYRQAAPGQVHLITFPVEEPQHFDAVIEDGRGRVREIQVKQPGDGQRRVWGAITAPARDFENLYHLWRRHHQQDEYLGDLFNAWLADGHAISADHYGTEYLDVGTLAGYRRAVARMQSGPIEAVAS